MFAVNRYTNTVAVLNVNSDGTDLSGSPFPLGGRIRPLWVLGTIPVRVASLRWSSSTRTRTAICQRPEHRITTFSGSAGGVMALNSSSIRSLAATSRFSLLAVRSDADRIRKEALVQNRNSNAGCAELGNPKGGAGWVSRLATLQGTVRPPPFSDGALARRRRAQNL